MLCTTAKHLFLLFTYTVGDRLFCTCRQTSVYKARAQDIYKVHVVNSILMDVIELALRLRIGGATHGTKMMDVHVHVYISTDRGHVQFDKCSIPMHRHHNAHAHAPSEYFTSSFFKCVFMYTPSPNAHAIAPAHPQCLVFH